jgi:hypothetical protein
LLPALLFCPRLATRRLRRPRSIPRCSRGIGSVLAGSIAGSRRPAGRSRCRCIGADRCRCCRCSGNRRAPDRTGRDRTCPGSRHSLLPCSRRTGWCICHRCKGSSRSTRSHPRSCSPRRCSKPAQQSHSRSRRSPSARRPQRIGSRSGMVRRAPRCHGARPRQTGRGGQPLPARHHRPRRARGAAVSQDVPGPGSSYRIAARPQPVPFLAPGGRRKHRCPQAVLWGVIHRSRPRWRR